MGRLGHLGLIGNRRDRRECANVVTGWNGNDQVIAEGNGGNISVCNAGDGQDEIILLTCWLARFGSGGRMAVSQLWDEEGREMEGLKGRAAMGKIFKHNQMGKPHVVT